MSSTIPVPRPQLRRLWVGPLGAILFMAVSLVQGAVREGYDPWHQSISALSLGPGGWVQQMNFLIFGLALVSTVPVWGRVLAGETGSKAFPLAIGCMAVSLIVAGLVPQDPAPGYDPEGLGNTLPTPAGLVHLAAAGVTAGSAVVALLIMARRLVHEAHWRGWAICSSLAALLTALSVVAYAVWSTRATGLAGTFERVAFMVMPVWGLALLLRLGSGAPFMVRSEVREPASPLP